MKMFEKPSRIKEKAAPRTSLEPTFIGKVMSFFALALAVSVGGLYVSMQYFLPYFADMPYLMWIAFAVELGIIFTARMWSQKSPLNKLLFAAFAFITGATLAPLVAIVVATPGGLPMLIKALLATVCMFTAAALIGWTTRFNLQGMRGFLLLSLIGMIVISVIGIFFPWGNTFEVVFSGAGILLFSGFTMYDFQKLKSYPEDRYIDAALALYLDIFNLFIYILRFILAMSRD